LGPISSALINKDNSRLEIEVLKGLGNYFIFYLLCMLQWLTLFLENYLSTEAITRTRPMIPNR